MFWLLVGTRVSFSVKAIRVFYTRRRARPHRRFDLAAALAALVAKAAAKSKRR